MEANTLDVLDVDWWTADSLPCLQENKRALLIYLDGSPWKPNAGGEGQGVTVDEKLANRTRSESNPSIFRLWCCACFHGPYSIICLYSYVTTSNCSVNSTLTCGLHRPLSHYHSPSDAADSQNTKISYHFMPPVQYFVLPNGVSLSWALRVFLERYKSPLTSADGPLVLIFQPDEGDVLELPYYTWSKSDNT